MVLMSRYITDANKTYDIMEKSQKGFIEGVNGTAENILTLTELFNDAQRKHKSLYVAALDFQNAFGSHFYSDHRRTGRFKTEIIGAVSQEQPRSASVYRI